MRDKPGPPFEYLSGNGVEKLASARKLIRSNSLRALANFSTTFPEKYSKGGPGLQRPISVDGTVPQGRKRSAGDRQTITEEGVSRGQSAKLRGSRR